MIVPPIYLDVLDAKGRAAQILLTGDASARETSRDLFSYTITPRAGVSLIDRTQYPWTPVKKGQYP
jgi:hypothetical protein